MSIDNNKTVSVVIPSMGRVGTLCRLLSHLDTQTLSAKEILIIEGSNYLWDKEQLPEIAKVIYMPNSSLYEARIKGITESTSKYIAFMDDDIIINNEYLKVAINCLETNIDLAGVGGIYTDKYVANRNSFKFKIAKYVGIYGDGKVNKVLTSAFSDYVRGDYTRDVTKAGWLFGCNGVYNRAKLKLLDDEERMLTWSFLEDVFLGKKITKKYGESLIIHPKLSVIHDPISTSGGLTKQNIRMMFLYRHMLFLSFKNDFNSLRYVVASIGFLLMLLSKDFSYKNVTEVFKVLIYVLNNWSNLTWVTANEYIIKKD